MPRIRIKNIGPIVDTGDIELSALMLIVGKQSSGKSTFMKILCFCRWIEKRIMLDGENLLKKYTHYTRFLKELKKFHRLDDAFFSNGSYILYDGDCLSIEMAGMRSNAKIRKNANFKTGRYNTKISFVPSERNLASAIQNIDKVYRSADYDSIFNYLLEYQEAKKNYDEKHPLDIPFDDAMHYYYDKDSDSDRIVLENAGRTISPAYASSGIQSALPLTILVNYVAEQVGKTPKSSLTDLTSLVAKLVLDGDKKDISADDVKKVSKMYRYRFAQLYIEELEENLFPKSQFAMVKNIVRCVKKAFVEVQERSYVVMTTHSPYVLTSFNVLMKIAQAKEMGVEAELGDLAEFAVPLDWFSAYCMTDEGKMESIVDEEYHFVKGDYLDSLSDEISEISSELDERIYAYEG